MCNNLWFMLHRAQLFRHIWILSSADGMHSIHVCKCEYSSMSDLTRGKICIRFGCPVIGKTDMWVWVCLCLGLRYSSFYDVKSVSLSYGFEFDCITVIWQQFDAIQASIKSAINQICKYIQHWIRCIQIRARKPESKEKETRRKKKEQRIKIHNFFNLWIKDNRHEC